MMPPDVVYPMNVFFFRPVRYDSMTQLVTSPAVQWNATPLVTFESRSTNPIAATTAHNITSIM